MRKEYSEADTNMMKNGNFAPHELWQVIHLLRLCFVYNPRYAHHDVEVVQVHNKATNSKKALS